MPSALSNKMRSKWFPSPTLACNCFFSLASSFFIAVFHFNVSLSFRFFPHPLTPGIARFYSLVYFPFITHDMNIVQHLQLFAFFSISVWVLLLIVGPTSLIFILPLHRNWLQLRRCTISLVLKFRAGMSWWYAVESMQKIIFVLSISVFRNPAWQFRCIVVSVLLHGAGVFACSPFSIASITLVEKVLVLWKLLSLICIMPVFSISEKVDSAFFVV